MKSNDIVAVMLFNPEVTLLDMDASGLNSSNTGIKNEQDYLNIKEVKENPKFRDSDGNFSENKFHKFYIDALRNYNILATGGWQPSFHENNIFAPVKQKRQTPDFLEILIKDPFQRSMSLGHIGEWGPRTKSIEEIALGQLIYDVATGKWLDAPEESFLDRLFGEPVVLATWDFNADKDGNPTNKKEDIFYKKGQYKYNDKGTFYYETLNGRNIADKQVLHMSDIITKEDSFWNKIDFLDSDDLLKSVMGTTAKNIALIGAMFIPYIGPWVTGATLLLQSLKLGATLGKMALGSNNSSVNTLLAWASATDLHESSSEYAKDPDNMWCWENLINTIGDVIGQLRQLRVLFESVPKILGKGDIFSEKGQLALQSLLMKKYTTTALLNTEGLTTVEKATALQELMMSNLMKAVIEAENITKNLQKYSGAISKAYMTGITVNDMYDEAIQAGMSDHGAMAMTLGYAAAEYALLSTGLGELILPELRAAKARSKAVIRAIGNPTIEVYNKAELAATTTLARRNFIQRMFNEGKKLRNNYYEGALSLAGNITATALGEGIEEVSEEFLADAIRGIHDLANWSNGLMFDTKNMFDRYAMNFVGGLIGGGISGATTDFRAISKYNKMTPSEAIKEFAYMYRNGDAKEVFEALDKMQIGNKDLSATETRVDDSGNILYAQGTEEDNLDKAIKDMIRHQLLSVIDVINANGANISDQSLFDANTLKEARFRMLLGTSTAARFSEVFAEKVSKLVNLALEESNFNSVETRKRFNIKRDTDTNDAYEDYKKTIISDKKKVQKEIQNMAEGKTAIEFMGPALLEMHTGVIKSLIDGPTLDLYVRRNHPSNKSYKELSEAEKTEWLAKYKAYTGSNKKDDVLKAYDTWERIMKQIKGTFARKIQEYAERSKDYSNLVDLLYSDLSKVQTGNPDYLGFASELLDAGSGEALYLAKFYGDKEFLNSVQLLEVEKRDKISTIMLNVNLTPEEQTEEVKKIQQGALEKSFAVNFKYLLDNYSKILDLTLTNKWINPVVKNKILLAGESINNFSEDFKDYLEGYASEEKRVEIEKIAQHLNTDPISMSEYFLEKTSEIISKIDKIKNISNSPILELLDSFNSDITGQDSNFSTLLSDFDAIIDATKNTTGVNLLNADLEGVISNIDEALNLVELLHSVLLGARADLAGYSLSENFTNGSPSWNMHFGMNSIINEVKDKVPNSGEKFLTIEGATADNIMLDLHILSKRLQFGKTLYGINSGQKLSRQPRITLRANLLIYKALSKLYDVAPDDIDKNILTPFFEGGHILSLYKDSESVDDLTLEKLEKARIELEDALYEFGKVNKGKNIFNLEVMKSLFEDKGLILNEATDRIDDNTLLWYIGSRMALKSSEFYNAYRQSLNEDLAPLSIQELGVYIQTANVLNGGELTKFKQLILLNILEYLEDNPNKEEILKNLVGDNIAKILALPEFTPYLKNLDFLPKYDNITFLEGIPGSGKTRAVMKLTANIIRKILPDLLKHAFIVDISEDNADKLAADIELSGHEALDRTSLMQRISNWKEAKKSKKNLEYYEFEDGRDFIVTPDGLIKSNYKLKSESNPASVIIIDELGRFTDLEMLTIDDYAKAHGISVLGFGDLDLTRTRGSLKIKIPGLYLAAKNAGIKGAELLKEDMFEFITNIARNNFIHGPKLGVSMRTRNILLEKNQSFLQAKISDPTGEILLHYYEGNDISGLHVLNGTKIHHYTGEESVVDNIISDIDKLIPTLQEKETIGFIYLSKDSLLYLKLVEKYGNKLTLYQGNSAQGKEARYYIMEAPTNESPEVFISNFYTGVTRALDGIIIASAAKTESFNYIHSVQDSVQRIQQLPKEAIKEFFTKRKAMYDRIFEGNNNLPSYIERSKVVAEAKNSSDIPKFKVIDSKVDGDRFVIEIEHYDLTDSDWLRSSRPSDTVVGIRSDLNGGNIYIDFLLDDGNFESVLYAGQLSDLTTLTPPEIEVVDPIQIGTTKVIGTEAKINEDNNPVPTINAVPTPEFTSVPKTNWDRHEHLKRVKEDPMLILFFTNAALETGGWEKDPNTGKVTPITLLSKYRIDSINGLVKLLGDNLLYDIAMNHLMELHRIVINSPNRAELDKKINLYFKDVLGIDASISLLFGLWSSSRTNNNVKNEYGIYERSPKERSLFNDIEGENINSRNLSVVFLVNGKNSLMLPIAYLSSPLTIALITNGEELIYPEVYSIILKYRELPHWVDKVVLEVLNDENIYNKYPALYNLFKLFRFNHNGFFPLKDDNFAPSISLRNYGVLIDKERGVKQINGRYLLLLNNSPISDFLKNKQIKASNEVYMFRYNQIENSEGNPINVLPGRPFILVTTDKENLDTDQAMISEYLNPNSDKVKLVYLLPPTLTFEDYVQSLMDFDNLLTPRPAGNNTTVFLILNTIAKNNPDLIRNGAKGQLSQETLSKIFELLSDLDREFQEQLSKPRELRNFSDFLAKLQETDDSFLPHQNTNLRKLMRVLRAITFPEVFNPNTDEGAHDYVKDDNMILKIKQALGDDFVIFDSVRFLPGHSLEFKPIAHDNFSNYSVGGRELLIDARVTTPAFGTINSDINEWINDIVENLILGPDYKYSRDKSLYVTGKLHRAFINGVKIDSFKFSDNFNKFVKVAEELGISYETPINTDLENVEILKIVNIINSDPNIRKFVIKADDDWKIIDYADDLQSGGIKNIPNINYNTAQLVTIGGINYSMQVDKDSVYLTEILSPTIDETLLKLVNIEWFSPALLEAKRGPAKKIMLVISNGVTIQSLLDLINGKLPETYLNKEITIDPIVKDLLLNGKRICKTIKINL